MPLGAFRLNSLARFTLTAEITVIRRKVGISAVGNAQVDTAQSKFGGSSAVFDGSGDILVTGKYDEFIFTSDFTWECWARPIDLNNDNSTIILTNRGSFDATNLHLIWRGFDEKIQWGTGSSGALLSANALSYNTWHHVAIVRDAGVMKLYINGTADPTTFSYSGDIGNISDNFIVVGGLNNGNNPFNGNIDEVRISNTARYTANFTPATAPHVNDDNTLLLIHADGTDGSTYFEDDNGVRTKKGVQAIGSAQVTTAQSKFSGTSLDPGTDGLIVQNTNNDFNFGTNDFTIEYWIWQNSVPQQSYIHYDPRDGSSNSTPIMYTNNGNVAFWTYGADRISTSFSISTWQHFAVCRTNGTTTLYKDGVSQGTYADSNNYTGSGTDVHIGDEYSVQRPLDGYIDEFRISNTARYTANFTPPTEPFVNDNNTLLLLHMDGTDGSTVFLDDNGARETINILAYGNTQIDTAQSKFGGASALFDGTNDHLIYGGTYYGDYSGDFTLEAWFNTDLVDVNRKIFDFRGISTSQGGNGVYYNISNTILMDLNTNVVRCFIDGSNRVTNSPTISTGTWYHFALSRSGTSVKIYLDGSEIGSYTQSTIKDYTTVMSDKQPIGASGDSGGYAGFWDGHLDEIRFSNIARYTSNFTPQTEPFSNDENTLLLLHMDGTDGSTVFVDDNGVTPKTIQG